MRFLILPLLLLVCNAFYAQPMEGLIAHWPFDGNALDSSGNEHHGILQGNVSGTTDRFGEPGKALAFDGNFDYVTVPDAVALRLGGDYTVSIWAKMDQLINDNTHAILSKRIAGSNNGYLCAVNGLDHPFGLTPGTVTFNTSTGNDPYVLTSEPILNAEWVNLIFTFDAETLVNTAYINNEETGTQTLFVPNADISADLRIGRDGLSSVNEFFYIGDLDDIRMYNRVLNEEEREILVQEGAPVQVTAELINSPSCFGSTDGSIGVSVFGGYGPYQYSIDGGATFQDDNVFANLPTGTYEITVLDAEGEQAMSPQLVLPQPAELQTFVVCLDEYPFNQCALETEGGTAPYSCVHNGQAVDCGNFSLTFGTNTFAVTDANGCVVEGDELVFTSSVNEVEYNIDVFPNPAEDQVRIRSNFPDATAIEVIDYTGKLLRTVRYSEDANVNMTGLPSGIYFLALRSEANVLVVKKVVKLNSPRA